jgi:hypothetical protein
MPSSFVHDPPRLDDEHQAQLKLEFDRWRIAIDVVRRLREAGFGCQLSEGFQTRQ